VSGRTAAAARLAGKALAPPMAEAFRGPAAPPQAAVVTPNPLAVAL